MSTDTTLEARPTVRADIGLGVFRIVVALLFMMHGTAKLAGWPQGSPAPLGAWPMWWAGALEIVLGGLIAIGLLTRPAARDMVRTKATVLRAVADNFEA